MKQTNGDIRMMNNFIDRFLSLNVCNEKVEIYPMNTGLYPLPKIINNINSLGKIFMFISFVVLTSTIEKWLFYTMLIVFVLATISYIFSLFVKQYLNVKRINYLNQRRKMVGRGSLSIFTF